MAGYLLQDDRVVPLRPRTFAVLRYLAARPNQLVPTEVLSQQFWPGPNVSRSALRVCIREIRIALGDSAQVPQYLETVRGRGIDSSDRSRLRCRLWGSQPLQV